MAGARWPAPQQARRAGGASRLVEEPPLPWMCAVACGCCLFVCSSTCTPGTWPHDQRTQPIFPAGRCAPWWMLSPPLGPQKPWGQARCDHCVLGMTLDGMMHWRAELRGFGGTADSKRCCRWTAKHDCRIGHTGRAAALQLYLHAAGCAVAGAGQGRTALLTCTPVPFRPQVPSDYKFALFRPGTGSRLRTAGP